MDNDIQRIIEHLRVFVTERDWSQFHNAKDLSIALSIEANELLEHFLWKKPDEVTKEQISHELADVLIYSLMFADEMGIDVIDCIEKKMIENALKYPADKVKGSSKKYTEY